MSVASTEIKIDNKAMSRLGYHFTLGAMQCLCVVLVFGFAFSWGVNHWWPRPTDVTDAGPDARSGFRLRTDHGTGCQYLETTSGHLTARLSASGVPICGKP